MEGMLLHTVRMMYLVMWMEVLGGDNMAQLMAGKSLTPPPKAYRI